MIHAGYKGSNIAEKIHNLPDQYLFVLLENSLDICLV